MADGSRKDIQTSLSPVYDHWGNFFKIICIETDVSDLKQVERELELKHSHITEVNHILERQREEIELQKQSIEAEKKKSEDLLQNILPMVPSSFIISTSAPPGFNPASLVKSTTASVCPALFKTPLSRALSGNMWPGLPKSSGLVCGSTSAFMVFALSATEMPVVQPCIQSRPLLPICCLRC